MDSLLKKIWETGALFVNELDILDCAILDPVYGFIGASWFVDIEIEGKLDKNGFVYDFSLTKKIVKETLKNTLDHALILPKVSKDLSVEIDAKQMLVKCNIGGNSWTYKCPTNAVFFIDGDSVDSKSIARTAEKVIMAHLPETVSNIRIVLREEQGTTDDSFFRYTHGLPFHSGLCQRLFHGHRSKVAIENNGSIDKDLQKYVATNLFQTMIHIADQSQFKTHFWSNYSSGPEGSHTTLAYESEEGYFEATMPSNKIFTVEQATSIESIARGVHKCISEKFTANNLRVRISEGINKGGICNG